MKVKFIELFDDCTSKGTKIKKEDYLNQGEYPIIDQGQEQVAGFSNDGEGLFFDVPAIIFGDHTRIIKYIDEPFYLGADGVKVLRCKREDVNYKYLYYALKRAKIPNTGYNRHFKWLKEVSINYPSVTKQEEIVNILDNISLILDYRMKQLDELDNLIKSQFIEMFGDPMVNPKGWEVQNIEDVVANEKNALKAGPFGSALKKEYYVRSGYKIYGQEQVISGDASFGDYYIDEERYKQLESCAIKAGDVLISLVGTYGKLLIIPKEYEPGIINPRLMKITFNREIVDTIFFKFFFASESLKRHLSDNTHGGTMDILNLGIVRKIPMIIPPIELQKEFATFVQQIEKQKFKVQQSLNETQLLFDSLMQQYFG